MRVVLAGQTYQRPGARAVNGPGVFTRRLAEGLAAAGHEVVVLFPSEVGRGYAVRAGGVALCGLPSLPLAPGRGVRVAVLGGRALVRLAAAWAPQVVHLQDHYPLSRSVLRAARRLAIPVVATNHFSPATVLLQLPALGPAARAAERALWHRALGVLRQVQAVTAPSRTAARELVDAGLALEPEVISCGVEVARFARPPAEPRDELRRKLGIPATAPVVAYLGRLDRDKSVDVLVRAEAALPRGTATLVVAGAGAEAGRLRALADRLGIEGEVVFTGLVQERLVPSLLHAADVFAMPGAIELQSIATLQALAAGLPVVAARAGALPELVGDGDDGLLFPPGDAVAAAEAVERLARSPALRARMGAVARERAQAHDLGRTVERFARLYGSVAARAGGRAAPVGGAAP